MSSQQFSSCTYQKKNFAVRLDFVFLHVFYEATIGISEKYS